MDPFVIIKALHIAVLVIIGGALYAFWRQSDRKNPFLLHWSVYEVALAAILSVLEWKSRLEGGYASVGGRFVIERRKQDWCLIEAEKERVRLFATLKDAKAGAEWELGQPSAE